MNGTAAIIANQLDVVRERTFTLYEPLASDDLWRTPDPIMSPPIWDLGHIAAYEELWLVCALTGAPSLHPDLQVAYDAFETPRAVRTTIRLLDVDDCQTYMRAVRARAFEVLEDLDVRNDDALTREGFVFDMVAQHEAQHTETVLQALQMFDDGTYRPPRPAAIVATVPAGSEFIEIPGGSFAMGAAPGGFAYDCERPSHRVDIPPFALARHPVTNAQHLAFIADGGYGRPEFWSADGWAWRAANHIEAPLYWQRDGEAWCVRSFDRWEPVRPDHPVCHVSWFEAEAYARWVGARLPTEAEWERAALGAPTSASEDETRQTYANLDQLRFGTTPVGAAPGDIASTGCAGMLGNVWEWTSSEFGPYPGFAAFPYPEYSEVFFGRGYRVLRGGSWATQPIAARATFRNWDHPQRRQIFAGFRLARDVA